MAKTLKSTEIEGKEVLYTHIFVPSVFGVKLAWREKLKVIFGKNLNLQLNVYMKIDKIVHITGELK